MTQVLQQTIGDIDRTAGQAAQGDAQCNPRLRQIKPQIALPGKLCRLLDLIAPAHHRQRRLTGAPREPQIVGRLRTVSAQRKSGW